MNNNNGQIILSVYNILTQTIVFAVRMSGVRSGLVFARRYVAARKVASPVGKYTHISLTWSVQY
jgi:hypothetical protein